MRRKPAAPGRPQMSSPVWRSGGHPWKVKFGWRIGTQGGWRRVGVSAVGADRWQHPRDRCPHRDLGTLVPSATGMKAAGHTTRYIVLLWTGIAVASGIAAGLGYVALDGASPDTIAFVMTFAAGAIIAMLAATVLPEAPRDGGPVVGLGVAAGG